MLNKLQEIFAKNSGFYKNILSVAIVVFLVKVFGFIKEIYISKSFGMSEELDVFFILILIPTFFKSVFLGAFKAVLIPNYIYAKKNNNTVFHNNLIVQTILLSIVLTFSVFLLLEPINTYLVRNYSSQIGAKVFSYQSIILWCIPLWTFSSLISGLLDVRKKFMISVFSPIITSVVIIISLIFYSPSAKLITLAYVVGAFCETIFLYLNNPLKLKFSDLNFYDSESVNLYKQFVPKLLSGLIIGLNPIIDQFFTSGLADGAISTLNYGMKFPAFVIGIFTVAVGNVILPYFAEIAEKSTKEIASFLKQKILYVFLFSSLCSLLLILFGEDLVTLFFQRGEFDFSDTKRVSYVLFMFSFQIPFYLMDIIFVRFLTAYNLNWFNILSSSISVVVNLICNFLLIEKFGVAGIALSTSIVIVISCLVKLLYVRSLIKRKMIKKYV